nr:hypothetical protein [Tanacetum cinerariifolium]
MSSDEASSELHKHPSRGLPIHSVDSPSPDYPGDDAIDEDEEDEDEEEEEHLASVDFTTAASLVVDPVPSAKETNPFETDKSAATPSPPLTYRTSARMSIRAQTPIPFSS